MICYAYIGVLLAANLLVGTQSAAVVSLSEDVDSSYVLDNRLHNQQTIGSIQIFLNTYIHVKTKACLKVVSIQVTTTEEYFLDTFQLTCDINPPFFKIGNMINIAGIVHLFVEARKGIWIVFKFGEAGGCVQRLYTDENWTPLDDVEEIKLSAIQCQNIINSGIPMQSGNIQRNLEPALPEFGKTQGQIITLGDDNIEDYDYLDNKKDKEETGASTRMVVSRLTHRVNKQCVDIVYIDMTESEDVLDSVQVTCDDSASFVKTKNMLVYGGMVYLRDHPQEAVWAAYLMKNKCELREYTDQSRQLIAPKNRVLAMPQCKRIVESQQISWLPKLPSNFVSSQQKPTSQPSPPTLTGIQKLIALHSSKPPPSSPTVPSTGAKPAVLGPQPVGYETSPPAQLVPQPVTTQPVPPPAINNRPPPTPPSTAPQALSATSTDPLPRPATPTSNPPTSTPPASTPPASTPPASTPPTPANNKAPGLFGGWFSKILGNSEKPSPPSPPPVPATPAVTTTAPPPPPPPPPVAPVAPAPPPPAVPAPTSTTQPTTAPSSPAPPPPAPAKKKWWLW